MADARMRIEEALGVHREEFRSPRVLRLTGQASRDGRKKVPLKHRKRGEYRDVIVPAWLWEMVKDLPDGPLCPGNDRPYAVYETVRVAFQNAAKRAGFRPDSGRTAYGTHSLQHCCRVACRSPTLPAEWATRIFARLTTHTHISCRKPRTEGLPFLIPSMQNGVLPHKIGGR